jgi:uncharacterized membrane protein YfcA
VTVGGLVAAPYGSRLAAILKADQLRGLMAVLVLSVALQLAVGLFAPPDDVFSIETRVYGEARP